MQDLKGLLTSIAGRMSETHDRGQVAKYISELAGVDLNQFGMAVALANGEVFSAGDADERFSIQSVSKVFTLCLALEKLGEGLWLRVGREPSGDPFNSIVQLEVDHGIPRNPLINAGAIVVSDVMLAGSEPATVIDDILNFVRKAAEDNDIQIDSAVAQSEQSSGYRNVALANFIRATGNLENDPAQTLEVYFNQCAIAMSCRQLALAGRMFAFGGRTSPAAEPLIPSDRARRVNALMLTCGHYDGSGDFAFHVGLPGKSGVGGGILAIAPGIASIAVWSPGLNEVGNSKLGTLAMEELAMHTGWSIFGV